MLRILFVTGSLVHGGAERHSITLMNRLAARGHECHAVYVKNDPSQLERIRLGPGGSVACLEAERYLDWGAVERFAARLGALRPSVIVAANAYALFYASLARRVAGLQMPLMVTYHSTLLVGIKERIKMLADRHFFRAADCLAFVSGNQCRHWQRRGVSSRRDEVIHNGVDLSHFNPHDFAAAGREVRQRHGIPAGDLVIGLVAVLRQEKNPQQLVEAIASLRRQGIPATALLVGDGPLRPAVEALAWERGVAPWVVISGLQEDVRPHIAACDAVTLCSTTEALSLAAIEALAMGKPVVHSQVGGAAELIEPGHNGYLFPVGDTPALVTALARLADRELARRLGEAGRQRVQREFSETAMVDRYEQILHELCAASPVPIPCPPLAAAGSRWAGLRE